MPGCYFETKIRYCIWLLMGSYQLPKRSKNTLNIMGSCMRVFEVLHLSDDIGNLVHLVDIPCLKYLPIKIDEEE